MKSLLTIAVSWFALSASLSAQTRNFLDIKDPGIQGDSLAEGFKDQIEVIAYGLEVGKPVEISSSGPIVQGDTEYSPLQFTAFAGKALPKIIQSAAQNTRHATITLKSTRSTGAGLTEFLEIKLEGAYFVQASLEGTSGDVPVYQFSVDYEKITITTTEFDPQTGDKKGTVPIALDRRATPAN